MGKNAYTKIEITLLAALLLGSCDKPVSADDAYDLADVARANSANALSQVSDLESRLADLESKVELNERNIETAFSNNEVAVAGVNRVSGRVGDLEDHLGM